MSLPPVAQPRAQRRCVLLRATRLGLEKAAGTRSPTSSVPDEASRIGCVGLRAAVLDEDHHATRRESITRLATLLHPLAISLINPAGLPLPGH